LENDDWCGIIEREEDVNIDSFFSDYSIYIDVDDDKV